MGRPNAAFVRKRRNSKNLLKYVQFAIGGFARHVLLISDNSRMDISVNPVKRNAKENDYCR
jgi:hypothetical protein